jgi:hypothetical protein
MKGMRTLSFVILCMLTCSAPVRAQHAPTIDLEAGGGYVFGGGVENPGPSLATVDVGAALWWSEHWGLALRAVVGPGEDLLARNGLALGNGDRSWRFLGTGELRYLTVTFRRRRSLGGPWRLETGAGLMLLGQFATVQEIGDPPRRVSAPATFFSGLALEALATRELSPRFVVKAGVTYDFNVETNNLQPVILAALRF